MPSSVGHAAATILLSSVAGTQRLSKRVAAIAALLAAAPDADAIGRPLGHGDVMRSAASAPRARVAASWMSVGLFADVSRLIAD